MTSKRFFPIIHYRNAELAVQMAQLAAHAGAHGVFLIDMRGRDDGLGKAAELIAHEVPTLTVGINYLSRTPLRAVRENIYARIPLTWSDLALFDSGRRHYQAAHIVAALYQNPKVESGPQARAKFEFFTSVGFKHQLADHDIMASAASASRLGFVVTTSGVATGTVPDLDKIVAMRQAVEGGRLAVASGIATDNIGSFLPYVDDFLVATSISNVDDQLDYTQTARLAEAIREYRASSSELAA